MPIRAAIVVGPEIVGGLIDIAGQVPDEPTYVNPEQVGDVSQEQVAEIVRRDGEAEYRHGMADYGKRPTAWKWFCLAANQGHSNAQFQLGNMHRWGHEPLKLDVVQAYLWFTLAASGGVAYAGNDRAEISKEMSTAQVAHAEKLVKEWKPGSCNVLPVRTEAVVPVSEGGDIEGRLRKLKKLYEKGLITESEYADKRREILRGL